MLLFDIFKIEGNQGRGIDIDVIKSSVDSLADERLESIDLFIPVFMIFFGVDLKMIALNEHWAAKLFFDCGSQNDSHQFMRPLKRVADFRFCDFKYESSTISCFGRPENGAAHLIRQSANVQGRDRVPFVFSTATRLIEVLNRGRSDP